MIGVIADDFTGATDVAVAFRREGLRTLLYFGVPNENVVHQLHDAVVIALKSRTAPVASAIRESLRALDWLRQHGGDRFYFKYCSTFDSTSDGNIGPVLDVLSDALGELRVVTTPSSPEHGRTQYMGYLFVEGLLLNESHMAHHPLTPMTDSAVTRLLTRQTKRRVELVNYPIVRRGAESLESAVAEAVGRGGRYILVDAVESADLDELGRAVLGHRLLAGAAGLARGLATAMARSDATLVGGQRSGGSIEASLRGPAAVLAGSCSSRTLLQVRVLIDTGHPALYLDATAAADPRSLAANALSWYDSAAGSLSGLAPVIYSSAPPAELDRVQRTVGVQRSAAMLEEAMGEIAIGLVERGVRRLITAGGETSGSIVSALGVSYGLVGPEIEPGVPWILTSDGTLALMLKSGNFGSATLLADASANGDSDLPQDSRAAEQVAP